MTFHRTGGPAPAYRLAPDTPAEIASDLAHLIAGSSGIALRQAPLPPLTAALSRRRERFGSMSLAHIAAQLCGGAA